MEIRPLLKASAIVCLLYSCGQSAAPEQAAASAETPAAVSLEAFADFPPEVDGCACYYSKDKATFGQGQYLYVDDFDKQAWVKINGVLVKLMLTQSDTMPEMRTRKIFANDSYKLTIDVKQVGQLDETWQQEGTLNLQAGAHPSQSQSIYGGCGC